MSEGPKQEITEEKKEVKHKRKKRGAATLKFIRIVLGSFLYSIVSALIIGLIFVTGTYFRYAREFEKAQPKSNVTKNYFYDKKGNLIYESYGTAKPTYIKLADVPEVVKKATLSSEDENFYSHGAVDLKGLARAAYINVKNSDKPGVSKLADLFVEKSYSQGGSTITQQLVKNIYLTQERSFDRKIKEVVFAFEMEKRYSKDEILEKYLNNVYYGEQSLGIVNASRAYYDKKVSKLSLGEATMLAGLPAAPSRLSPVSGSFDDAKERQRYVLSMMYYDGYITLNDAKEAANESLYFSESQGETFIKHPYFVDFVKGELEGILGKETVDAGGLSIYTTLNPVAQKSAEKETKEQVERLRSRNVSNSAAMVVDNQTGEIAAMVGGVDWEKSKVNVATSKRQPGSSFKPFVYLTGLMNGYTSASRFWDGRVNFGGNPGYVPKNYDGRYHGYVTMRTAIANSLNIPAVEMTKLVGIDKVLATVKKMGIEVDDKRYYGLSLGLGSAEVSLFDMTRAYSTLANGGKAPSLSGIDKVVDSRGTTIYVQPELKKEVLDPKIAYIMTSILTDNYSRRMVFGLNSPLQLGDRPVAAKTGTTDSYADTWTFGYTPQYTTGVWVGNNDRSKMQYTPGAESAAPIWNGIMKEIHKNQKIVQFEKPKGLMEAWISPSTGKVTKNENKPNILNYFLKGTVPRPNETYSYLKLFH